MDLIDNIFILLYIFLICGTIIFIFSKYINPYLQKINQIKMINVENTKMDLFMKIDPTMAEKEVESYIKRYIDNYILKNFIIKKEMYIRKESIEKMVRDITKSVFIDLPELYVFYIRSQVNIENEDNLLAYLNNKCQDMILGVVTEYNKPN